MRIAGVDPGGMTGVAIIDTGSLELVHFGAYNAEMFTDSCAANLFVGCQHVAVEKYTITARTAKKTRQSEALWMTGAAMVAARLAAAEFYLIERADSKNMFPDEALRDLDLWTKSLHTRDATRVALTACRRLVPHSV